MQKILYIPIDTTVNSPYECEDLIKRGDILALQIKIFKNMALADLTGQTVDLILKKSDNTFIEKTILDISNGTIMAVLTVQATNSAGIVSGEVQITDANSQTSTNTFTFNVDNAIASDNIDLSENDIQTINDLKRLIIAGDIIDIDKRVTKNTTDLSDITQQKANDTDSNRTTSDKTVTGAINELNSNKANKTEVNALQTQVNSLASDTPKGSYDTLALLQSAFPTGATGKYIIGATTEVKHWYIWNGSEWIDGGVYQGLGITDKSVSYSKLSTEAFNNIKSISEYKQMTYTVSNGLYQISDGALRTDFADWRTTGKVACTPGDALRVTAYVTGSIVALVLFYDVNGNYLNYIVKGGDVGVQYTDYEFFVPDNAYYVAIDGHKNGMLSLERLEPVHIIDKIESLNLKVESQDVYLIEIKNGYWNSATNDFVSHTSYKYATYDVSTLNQIALQCQYALYTDLYVLFDANGNILDRKSYSSTFLFNDTIDVSEATTIGITYEITNESSLSVTTESNAMYNPLMALKYNKYWKNKKIVWLGTSIPAGGLTGSTNSNAYPQRIGKILGATVYNEAIGSSTVHCKNPNLVNATTNPYGFINDFHKVSRCLSNSIEEMNWVIANYNSSIFTANVPTTAPTGAVIRGYSWENKIKQYFTEDKKPGLWIFDHGFNDFGHNQYLSESEYSTYGDYNLYTFRGAMNYLINKIKEFDPFARIIIIGNYENQARPEVAQYQEVIADDWSFPIYRQWEEYGWSQRTLTTTGYWNLTDPTNMLYTWVASGGSSQTLSYLDLWLPDEVHPHSDASGNALRFMAEHIANWLEEKVKV